MSDFIPVGDLQHKIAAIFDRLEAWAEEHPERVHHYLCQVCHDCGWDITSVVDGIKGSYVAAAPCTCELGQRIRAGWEARIQQKHEGRKAPPPRRLTPLAEDRYDPKDAKDDDLPF